MSFIENINAYEILDSRGNPTVEVCIKTYDGYQAKASVPSGASIGEYEAIELRDNDMEYFLGKGVKKAINNINTVIFNKLKNICVTQQNIIDNIMINLDNTPNKRKLGANAILAVSLACAKLGAKVSRLPLYQYLGGINIKSLPTPLINILNGGMHAENNLDIQEFMIVPMISKDFKDNLNAARKVIFHLKKNLKKLNFVTSVGDEGGFAPNLKNNEQALILIKRSILDAGYEAGKDIFLAIDVAASELYNSKIKKYVLKGENLELTTSQMIKYYENLINKFPIISIEDALDQNDWYGWKELTEKIGHKVQLVGDDLFVTNKQILKKGIEKNIANAILIKINQIGTLTETFECIEYAKCNNYGIIISHRSGETEENIISDIAVATSAGQIKIGSLNRTDRLCKYNQLLRIEQELNKVKYYHK